MNIVKTKNKKAGHNEWYIVFRLIDKEVVSMIIAIDGPAGAGKSTIAKKVVM